MRWLCSYFLAVCLFVLFSSCSAVDTAPQPAGEPIAYEDTVYCFNQRSIVHLSGKAGVIDESGTLVLSPEWDAIEFLDDEVALLRRDGRWFLSTRGGRIFAESDDSAGLESDFRRRLEDVREQDLCRWDTVLDKLEVLCETALACRSRRPDRDIRSDDTRAGGPPCRDCAAIQYFLP